MSEAARDRLWEKSFATLYDSESEEIAADLVIRRLQYFDEITKVLVAVTASSSAVAGFALWNQPGFRYLWAIVAGIAALMSIVHSSMGIPGRLKKYGEASRHFAILASDLATFRDQMEIFPEFSVPEFNQKYTEYRERYAEGLEKLPNDLFFTDRLANRAQDALDRKLEDYISEN